MYTVADLQQFEQEIADIYAKGGIRAPVHLRASEDGSYERNLIEIFKDVRPKDYFLGYWDSHIPALLKGVPREEVKAEILKGNSISLSFPMHRVLCSGIVGSLMGVAVGIAYGIKRAKLDERVYLYCGDMAARTGIWHEATIYSFNHNLPLTWVVGDNGLSVMTDTKSSWGEDIKDEEPQTHFRFFEYVNKYPHSGLKQRIQF